MCWLWLHDEQAGLSAYWWNGIKTKKPAGASAEKKSSKKDGQAKAVEAYTTQFHTVESIADGPQTYISTPDFLESVIARARMFGKRIGVKYAEGFISEKKIGIRSLDALIMNET